VTRDNTAAHVNEAIATQTGIESHTKFIMDDIIPIFFKIFNSSLFRTSDNLVSIEFSHEYNLILLMVFIISLVNLARLSLDLYNFFDSFITSMKEALAQGINTTAVISPASDATPKRVYKVAMYIIRLTGLKTI
jgi:hypothetical protein